MPLIADPLEHLWELAPAFSAPLGGEVHLWCVGLAAPPERVGSLARLLSPDERARAGRFRFERDRRRYVVARGTLRVLLGTYLGEPPARLRFEYAAHGKPLLSGAGGAGEGAIHFNVAHTDDLAVLGFARGCSMGVDVERVRPMEDVEQIAARFFSPAEKAELKGLPPAERVEAFYRCWTRKEAVIKATGEGLSRPLDEFDVSLAGDRPARLLRLRGDPGAPLRWTLRELRPAVGYVGAVAVDRPTADFRTLRVP